MYRLAASLLIALLAGMGVNSQTSEEALPKPRVVVIGRIESDSTRVEAPPVVRTDSETATEEERVEVRRIVFRVDRVVKGKLEAEVIGAYSLRKCWVPKETGLRGFLLREGTLLPDVRSNLHVPLLKLWELRLIPSSDDGYCPSQRGPCFEMVRDGMRPVKDFYPEGRKLRT